VLLCRVFALPAAADQFPQVVVFLGQQSFHQVQRRFVDIVAHLAPETLEDDVELEQGSPAMPAEPFDADAARFVTELVRQLSDPNLLLLET